MKTVSLKIGPAYAISPVTFQPIFKHPLMNLGEDVLKDEVKEWLHDTCKRPWTFDIGPYGKHVASDQLKEITFEEGSSWAYHILFESDEDATLFMLKWL